MRSQVVPLLATAGLSSMFAMYPHGVRYGYAGNDWTAFDALPAAIRQLVAAHAYDAWAVNVMMLWQHYKRLYGRTMRAEQALIRYLDYCERL